MKFADQPSVSTTPLGNISQGYLVAEETRVRELVEIANAGSGKWQAVQETAASLVRKVRKNSAREGGIDAFLQQYDLSSEEGVLLHEFTLFQADFHWHALTLLDGRSLFRPEKAVGKHGHRKVGRRSGDGRPSCCLQCGTPCAGRA